MNIAALQEEYACGRKPSEVIASIYGRIEAGPLNPVWISLVPREQALGRAHELERKDGAHALPLYGIPFAVKDNFDVAGMPTTAGCPAYSYTPGRSAFVVERLTDAGAILIGKTNLDQFATGLSGTRSPYGACSSVFDSRYISGGSSSGSAVAVASELVAFALGTDTAGSGRVPAAFNDLVGLKPSRGILSASGVVPACRSLDCVSVFSHDCAGAQAVWSAARGLDPSDPYSREPKAGDDAAPWLGGKFRFGVPAANQLEFFGDEEAAGLYCGAVARLEKLGGEKVEIDFPIFRAAADLLYSGPWLAERLAAIREFLNTHGAEMHPVVYKIIAGASRYSAVETFEAEYRLRELKRASQAEWDRMDVLLLPTTGTTYTIEEMQADPVRLNTNLGYYTNFVNLLDLAAVAAPGGFRRDGLPFGVSFIGPAFSDEALLALAGRFHREPSTNGVPACDCRTCPPGCVQVAVVGAHLSGQPLNFQLTDRGARLQRAASTASGYRLYALEGEVPKPGLVRDDAFHGPGVEVEVWAMPEDKFGGFVATIPRPLSIGNVLLREGNSVKCFLCEAGGAKGAREITHFGGWRNYLAYSLSAK